MRNGPIGEQSRARPDHWHAGGRRLIASPLTWVVGNLLAFMLVVLDVATFDGGLIHNTGYLGRDFINVWTAGTLVLGGEVNILYDVAQYRSFQQHLFAAGLGEHNYSYPPLTLPLTVPFALLPYPVALLVWLAGTGWLFLLAARPWWRAACTLPAWVVLLTPAAMMNVWAGHYGFLVGALLLFGWHALERGRPLLAGLCFGLMAVKPHLAVLVPLILVARREWTAIAAAAAAVIAAILVSVALFGIDPWRDYLFVTVGVQGSMIDAGDAFFRLMSTSTATALLQLGMSRMAAGTVQGALAIAVVAATVMLARRAALRDVALFAATATFLLLPYAFNYDLTVPSMAAALLIASGRLSRAEVAVALGGFMAPQLGMLGAALGLPAMPVLLAGLAVVQFRVAWRDAPDQPRSRRPSSRSRSALSLMKPAASRWS